MKKIWILAAALVLTAALMTACGCTRRNPATTPTGMTEPMPTVAPTTVQTTPPTYATHPTNETILPTDTLPGHTDSTDTTDATDSTAVRRRAALPEAIR